MDKTYRVIVRFRDGYAEHVEIVTAVSIPLARAQVELSLDDNRFEHIRSITITPIGKEAYATHHPNPT